MEVQQNDSRPWMNKKNLNVPWIDCRKTKTKENTLTNHNSCNRTQRTNQNSKQIHVTGAKSRKTRTGNDVTIGFGFTSDWSRKWREIFLSDQRAK